MKISSIYSDGMILQRNKINTITGIFDPEETINADLDGMPLDVTQKEDGTFTVTIGAQEAGGPHVLTIGGQVIREVLFGDVYILGGQSNMEFTYWYDISKI